MTVDRRLLRRLDAPHLGPRPGAFARKSRTPEVGGATADPQRNRGPAHRPPACSQLLAITPLGVRLSAPARRESGRPRDPCGSVRLRDSEGWFGWGAPAALAHKGCSSSPGVRKWRCFLDWSRRRCRTSALAPHSRPDTQILARPSPPRGSAAAGPLLGGLQAAAPAPMASRSDKKCILQESSCFLVFVFEKVQCGFGGGTGKPETHQLSFWGP